MTNLNETQERLLASVQEAAEKLGPVLQNLLEEYEAAVFRAKGPVIDLINSAEDGGVPARRIADTAMGFTYVPKLRAWMQPGPTVLRRLMAGEPVAVKDPRLSEAADGLSFASRDPHTGIITVAYHGETYEVDSTGPDESAWSVADPGIPQGVYDLVKERFPSWELLEAE